MYPADPGVSQARTALARLPLRFEANQGQAAGEVRYTAHAGGYALLLTSQGPTLRAAGSNPVSISLVKGNGAPRIEPLDRLPARTNYFLGSRENWHTEVPSYARVRYREVYPGIDVVYYGNQSQLEYDFVLRPGADPNAIRMKFHGPRHVEISPEGDLVLESDGARIVQKKPAIYQDDPRTVARREVAGHYVMLARNVAGFRVDRYDRARPLVIDPTLTYCTYLGGTGSDQINAVKMGPKGRLYIAGQTPTQTIAATDGAYNGTKTGLTDIFLAIIDTTPGQGFPLVYYSYLGGTQLNIALAIDVDAAGIAYLTGTTTSTDFPVTGNAYQATGAASTIDAFVVKLDPSQVGPDELIFSTYLGGPSGTDSGNGIAVGQDGMIYVIGNTKSTDFPLTDTAYQNVLWGPQDTFLCKLDPDSGSLLYSSYLGGESQDDGRAILVDAKGLVYFASSTLSLYFPVAGYNWAADAIGAQDIVVGVVDMTKSGTDSLVYSTYFGGTGNDEVRQMAFDAKGNLLITGYTLSTDFPVAGSPLQGNNNGNGDAFVSLLNPAIPFQAGLLYSTYLGGAHGEVGYDVKGDAAGYIYVTGYTLSSDFPILNAPQPQWGGGTDIFLMKFKTGVAGPGAIQFSTFIGATSTYRSTSLALGADGTVFLAGFAYTGLPVTDGALQSTYGGGGTDGFLVVVTQ